MRHLKRARASVETHREASSKRLSSDPANAGRADSPRALRRVASPTSPWYAATDEGYGFRKQTGEREIHDRARVGCRIVSIRTGLVHILEKHAQWGRLHSTGAAASEGRVAMPVSRCAISNGDAASPSWRHREAARRGLHLASRQSHAAYSLRAVRCPSEGASPTSPPPPTRANRQRDQRAGRPRRVAPHRHLSERAGPHTGEARSVGPAGLLHGQAPGPKVAIEWRGLRPLLHRDQFRPRRRG